MEFKSSIFAGLALATILFGAIPVNSQTSAAVNDGLTRARQVSVRGEASAIDREQQIRRPLNFCDASFVGESLSFASATSLTLDDLLDQIHRRFGVNFIVGNKVGEIPINIKSGSIPWNVLLNSQLFVSGIRAKCIDDSLVQLVLNSDLPKLQETAEVSTRFVRLRFLQSAGIENVNVAGQSRSGGGKGGGGQSSGGQDGKAQSNFDKLFCQIESILGVRSQRCSSGGSGGSAAGGGAGAGPQLDAIRTNRALSQIPGRNLLVITATEQEHALIDQIVEQADRPPFQVLVKGLVYTANENLLRDLGVSTNLSLTTANGNPRFGMNTPNLGSGGSLFDFSAVMGTAEFSAQASALENKGAIKIESRPFALVVEGESAELVVGRSIPVPIQGGISGSGALEVIEASNILNVIPFVIEDENGNPTGVSLSINLTANELDLEVPSAVPVVNEKSILTRLFLNQETTVILVGFTVDSKSDQVSKTPGLGDIPIIGYLFKRKFKREELNRLYFAISVTVIPYGAMVQPVDLPNVTTEIPAPSIKK
jgi:type II secretory pathway component GspD/PulD (secretin)